MTASQSPAASSSLKTEIGRPTAERLRKRADFLAAAKGQRFFLPAFALQARCGGSGQPGQARFGITVTRKTGTAVERNRIRRRLREAIRTSSGMDARPGCDYVIVARRDAISRPFAALVRDLERAVAAINAKLDRARPA